MKKKLLCFFKGLSIFILMLLLSIVIYLFCLRNIFKSYVNEDNIRKEISSINIMDLLKENGEEIESVKELKKELVNVGIPEETIDSVLNSTVITDVTANVVSEGVNYIFTGKEPDIVNLKSEDIIEFTKDNMASISLELKNNNVPGASLLTSERQDKIIKNMEVNAPKVEEKINLVIDKVEEKIKSNENYEKFVDYQNKLNKLLDIVRFIYGDNMTYLLMGVILILSLLLILVVHSYYKYLKYFGITSLLVGIYFFISSYAIIVLKDRLVEIFNMFEIFINTIINSINKLFNQYSMIFTFSFILLILLNILIHFILEYLENRKFNKI